MGAEAHRHGLNRMCAITLGSQLTSPHGVDQATVQGMVRGVTCQRIPAGCPTGSFQLARSQVHMYTHSVRESHKGLLFPLANFTHVA